MSSNRKKKYLGAEREQFLLLPPDIEEWVPKEHLARQVLLIVQMLDLSSFYAVYEKDGKGPAGRPPYDPRMMLALLYYALEKGQRSSRAMEELVRSDLGARMIMGGRLVPDHSIFAAFRKRHAAQMKDALAQIILLCYKAGIIDLEHVSIDSTVIKANAARRRHLNYEKLKEEYAAAKALAEKYLEEAQQADASEQTRSWRKVKRAQAKLEGLKEILNAIQTQDEGTDVEASEPSPNQVVREERERLGADIKQSREQLGLRHGDIAAVTGIPRRRLADYERGTRAILKDHVGPLEQILQIAIPAPERLRKLPGKRKPTASEKTYVNLTDPSAYLIGRRKKPYVVGYLPQIAVCGKNQVIVGADLALSNNDEPFLTILVRQAENILNKKIKVVTADSGYWGKGGTAIQTLVDEGRTVLCPPRGKRIDAKAKSPEGDNVDNATKMRRLLQPDASKPIYNRRSGIVEPVNAHTKVRMKAARFLTRGALNVLGEACAHYGLHNILKLIKCGFCKQL